MSHAYSYGHLTYYTAWLKANYPEEFYCALISTENNLVSQRLYMEDARNKGINILPPDVNESIASFGLNRNNDIIYGLSGIKGLGESVYDSIINLRPYTSLAEFFLKTHLLGGRINKKTYDALIMSGAVDSFGYKRSVVMRSYNKFILDFDPKGLKKKACAKLGAIPEDIKEEFTAHCKLEDSYFNDPLFKEYSLLEILDAEKELIGVHISGNPIDIVIKNVHDRYFAAEEIIRIVETKGSFSGCCVVSVSSVRALNTKTGKKMCFAEVTDHTGKDFSTTIFDPVYTDNMDSIKPGRYLQIYVNAKPSYKNNGTIDCIVNAVIDLSEISRDAVKEERVTSVKEAYIVFDGMPALVRFKTVLNKLESIQRANKYSEGSTAFVVIKNNSGYVDEFGMAYDNRSEILFGPFYTETIDIDVLRELNKIPEVTINTR